MKKLWKLLLKPSTWIAKAFLFLLVVGFLALDFLESLEPIRAFLNSENLSFSIGQTRISAYLMIKALITIMLFFLITGVLSEFGEKRIKSIKGIHSSNKALINKAFHIFIYFFGFIIALNILGIDLTAFAIFSGAIGIGIGFGLQKITSNFISGLILLFEKSIENGDMVELSDGTYGLIRKTSARYTLLETFEGREMMIPNEDFIINRVTNWTFNNRRGRLELNIGVAYESDIEKVMELILDAAKEHPRCMDEPGPSCYLKEFGDSSVNFMLFFWVEDVSSGRYRAQSDVMMRVWKKFKEHNISIPFPQRDIYIKNASDFK
jgi:small-conductance mechanosensitive channel